MALTHERKDETIEAANRQWKTQNELRWNAPDARN